MLVTLELPEDIAQGLETKWKDLPGKAPESLALEAYRSDALSTAQLRRLLGFETRMQVDAFLKEHEVDDFTATDFEQDSETLRQLRARKALNRAGACRSQGLYRSTIRLTDQIVRLLHAGSVRSVANAIR
jgi:hypothetical protein